MDDWFFLRESSYELMAAMIDIGQPRWVCIGEDEATIDAASKRMREGSFDILPIQSRNGKVREYFRTANVGDYSQVSRASINHKDIISIHTPIRDLIKMFAQESNRFFYFLANEGRIAGLITIANLNCRQVQVYLFGLLCELERSSLRTMFATICDRQQRFPDPKDSRKSRRISALHSRTLR